MTALTVRALGHADVLHDAQPIKWGAESARDLVFYLLSSPDGRHREEIIEALWHADPDARTGNRFRVALHRARTALGGTDTIVEAHGRYRLADDVLRASDIYRMYEALEEADRAEGDARAFALNRAIEAYGGAFLPHVQAEWAHAAREEHCAAYVRARLERSLLHCEHLHCDLAVQDLTAALKTDPFIGENHHQKLMTCLTVVEDKYAATEHYRRFAKFLHDDLGDTPMPETRALAERVKTGEHICVRGASGAPAPARAHRCPLTPDGQCHGTYAQLLQLL
ncbi:AfsR/SARP family transcriptional regulator [Deinococcus maricopensis]|uniref:Transcriptional regulator, SARP family n=1 Tax=Deinococcus maricopensis (strain DSM 21211 / LMG 22137 / NRRL B-23946 / LB-34) TaxID=709986 RepID=E8U4T0_DEIML|nr:BTAD domain-containing putative transcriptional regulator [Deinococcus maricopensis]ADV66069.1 transcriptional regulator, SARP family [Deinococcus maricopensis DSM 21211]